MTPKAKLPFSSSHYSSTLDDIEADKKLMKNINKGLFSDEEEEEGECSDDEEIVYNHQAKQLKREYSEANKDISDEWTLNGKSYKDVLSLIYHINKEIDDDSIIIKKSNYQIS
jgi:hypothetical protein